MKSIQFLKPIIEVLNENDSFIADQDIKRQNAAKSICRYLEHRDKSYLKDYYDAVEYLLNNDESKRILLYLPFQELADAPDSFRRSYMNAWWDLANITDVVENFHEGDIFEVDARPRDLPRVVKCAHLLPWILDAGYMNESEISAIFKHGFEIRDEVPDNVFLQSLSDTLEYISDHCLMSEDCIRYIDIWSREFQRSPYRPLYISDKRKKWLQEKMNDSVALATPSAKLEGPFSSNLKYIDISDISASLGPGETILIGGSRIKGYGTVDSDIDIWNISELISSNEFYLGSPHAVHIYFNTAGISTANDSTISDMFHKIVCAYDDPKTRKYSLERLEYDLLLYRLLHKGFSRFTGIKHFETTPYDRMSGDCPFYHDGYRRIATMLFAKYVFIPHVN